MDDVELAILDAWQRLRPRLLKGPRDLVRRLARRPSLLRHPPRAWCLALRANDTRLESFACVQQLSPSHPDARAPHAPHQANQVILDSFALHKLCAPVRIDPPGQTLQQVAAKLGVSRMGLLLPRVKGIFQTHHVEGLGGYWGHPVPLLYTDRDLNPGAANFALADDLWSHTAASLISRIPDAFSQTLHRLPVYQSRGPMLDDSQPSKPRRLRNLPPAPPDYVWYKWKGDQFMGCDWRNPRILARHLKHQARKERDRLWHRKAWASGAIHRPSKSIGSYEFRGWYWICPTCDGPFKMLYCPLPPVNLLNDSIQEAADPAPAPSFACMNCHHVTRFSRAVPNAWNAIVSYLSGGLLTGRTPSQIAVDLQIPYYRVKRQLSALYAQHQVKGGRQSLAAKLGVTLPPQDVISRRMTISNLKSQL